MKEIVKIVSCMKQISLHVLRVSVVVAAPNYYGHMGTLLIGGHC